MEQHRALLLGVVEVTRPLAGLDTEGRLRIAQMCHTTVTTSQVQDPEWLGQPVTGLMVVEVALGHQYLQVMSDDYMVSQHDLTGMSVITALRNTNGHLVYIGDCHIKRKRLAVVLDISSEQEADRLVKAVQDSGRVSPRALPVPDQSSSEGDSVPPPLPPRAPAQHQAAQAPSDPVAHQRQQRTLPPESNPPGSISVRRSSLQSGGSARTASPSSVQSMGRAFRSVSLSFASERGTGQARSLPPKPALRPSLAPVIPRDCAHLAGAAPPTQLDQPVPHQGGRRRESLACTEEEKPYENCERCFNVVGITAEESEYIYINKHVPQQPENSPSSAEQEITHFLTNEREYLNTITAIKDARASMTPELKTLLREIDILADIHLDMYRELYQAYPSGSKIAQVFISRREQLDPYKYYLMNAPKINMHLAHLSEEVKQRHPTLVSDITKSWKRLHYYFMSLEKMLASAPAEEQPVVQEAVDLFRDMYRQGDSGILIDAVKEAPLSLYTMGTLLLHGAFFIKDSSGLLKSKSEYRVLMFADMIVITLPSDDKYLYQEHLLIKQLHLLPQAADGENSFVLELLMGGQRRNKSYTFYARHKKTKAAWVGEISRLHLDYIKQVKQITEQRFGCSRQ